MWLKSTLQMRSGVLSAMVRRRGQGAAKLELPVATDMGCAFGSLGRLEDGGFRRQARCPYGERLIVHKRLPLFFQFSPPQLRSLAVWLKREREREKESLCVFTLLLRVRVCRTCFGIKLCAIVVLFSC